VTEELAVFGQRLESIQNEVLSRWPGATGHIQIREQYRNMKEVLDQHPHVANRAAQAIKAAGLTLKRGSIRGGTDGSRLSFMGLPCPNVFAGEHAFHSKQEWVSVQDMEKATEVLIRIAQP
jgi:tripeptide aminopeptidase